MPKRITIHCVRHAQGYHNLSTENHTMRDPDLTPFGISQCEDLRRAFPYNDKIAHLVASPLRRTIYTALHAFPGHIPVIAHADLQETSDLPCDTGSPVEVLEKEFGPKVDLTHVPTDWCSKRGKYAPAPAKIEARAAEARKFLRSLGQSTEGTDDVHIVVVTHGGYLHYFTEDWTGNDKFTGALNTLPISSIFLYKVLLFLFWAIFNRIFVLIKRKGTGWANTEFRSYEFKSLEGEEAHLVETRESRERRKGDEKPLTEAEQIQLRKMAEKNWGDQGIGISSKMRD